MPDYQFNLSHTIVICSRDRKESLFKAIGFVLNQEPKVTFQAIILVVNFKDDQEYKYLEDFLKLFEISNFYVIRTTRGLPSARNQALACVGEVDVVHFIDDDVCISEDYIKKVDDFFRRFPEASGGAPIEFVPGSKTIDTRFHGIKKYLGLEPQIGRVSVSMRNSWGNVSEIEPVKVEWLPGLAMFYRTSALQGHFFEEKLENFTLGGYGLGEDLIFTLKLSEAGENLFAVPGLVVSHATLPNPANASDEVYYAQGELRAELIKIFPGKFNVGKYFFCLFFEFFLVALNRPLEMRSSFFSLIKELRGFYSNKEKN